MFKVGQVMEEFKGVEDGACIAVLDSYMVIYCHVSNLSNADRDLLYNKDLWFNMRKYKNVINIRIGTDREMQGDIYADICYNPNLSPRVDILDELDGYKYFLLLVVVDTNTGMIELIRVENLGYSTISSLSYFMDEEISLPFDLESYNKNVEELWGSPEGELKFVYPRDSVVYLRGRMLVQSVVTRASGDTEEYDGDGWW